MLQSLNEKAVYGTVTLLGFCGRWRAGSESDGYLAGWAIFIIYAGRG